MTNEVIKLVSELERLWALKKSGALTEDEFAELKAKAVDEEPRAVGAGEMQHLPFEEQGVSVDNEFVRFDSRALRVSEIKSVDTMTMGEDGHVAPMLWLFAALTLIIAFAMPAMFLVVIILVGAAMHKMKNRKPLVHRLLVSTGGMLNTHIYKSTDEEHVARLRQAVETAVSKTGHGSKVAT